MGKRLLLLLGWLWPFAVAAAAVAAISAGHSLRSDGAVMLLFLAALLGSPAVVATITGWLPAAWSAELRGGLAVVLAVPVLAFELFLAMCLLAGGRTYRRPRGGSSSRRAGCVLSAGDPEAQLGSNGFRFFSTRSRSSPASACTAPTAAALASGQPPG